MKNLVSKTKWIVRSDSPGWPLGFKYLIILIHISTCKCVFVRICVHTYTHKWGAQDISSHQPYNVLLRRVPRRWDDTHSCTAIESSATPSATHAFPPKAFAVCLSCKAHALYELSHLALTILSLCPWDPDTCQLICFPFQVHLFYICRFSAYFKHNHVFKPRGHILQPLADA